MLTRFFHVLPPLAHLLAAIPLLIALALLSSATRAQGASPTTSTAPTTQDPMPATHNILFFGDSLTAGFGLDNASQEAFPALIQQKLKQENINYTVINGGVSGDTSAGGLRRIDWALRRPVDVLVLELGGNDGLRGVPPEEMLRNLQAIIDKVRAKNPQTRVLVAGMQMPANFGADFVAKFQAVFPTVAKASNATLLPFLLDGVGGIPRYNQRDQIHPTAEGHRIIADLIWPLLKPLCT